MSTKAVHLEQVEDLSTMAILAAIRRVMARRGKMVEKSHFIFSLNYQRTTLVTLSTFLIDKIARADNLFCVVKVLR
jgi:hypothetical protein